MLSSYLYLNTRHRLPVIQAESRLGVLESHSNQPHPVGGHLQEARSNMGSTLVRVETDTYPSRHAYGAENLTDLTGDSAQRGKQDVQEGTSTHTQDAWQMIERAGKKPHGNVIYQMARKKLQAKFDNPDRLEVINVPRPTVTVQPSEIVGTPDPGNQTIDIEITPNADVQFHPGSITFSMKDPGSIENWVSVGHYDINA